MHDATVPSTLSFREARLVDLGCGRGQSLIDAQGRFGMPGVGIELQMDRVAEARNRGLSVHQGDIRELDPGAFPLAEYVYLDNVLEHLPGLDDVDRVLGVAARIARRLIVIRHPSFEDVDYLAGVNCKLYWTDWPTSHTAPAKLRDLVAMANGHGIYRIVVRPLTRVPDSAHPAVLPLGAPPDQVRADPAVNAVYDPERHGPKPHVVFDRPVYDAFELLLLTGDGTVSVGGGGGGGGEPGARPDAPSGDDRPELLWQELPGHAPSGWADQLAAGIGAPIEVVELPDGRVSVIEGGTSRAVATPLVGRALQLLLGSRPMPTDEHGRLPAGPPVAALKVPGQPAFIVVGGRRHDLPRIPATLQFEADQALRFDAGPPLDVLGAAAQLHAERRARKAAKPAG